MSEGTAKKVTICGHDLSLGDFVKVQYTTGREHKGATIEGKIIELWSPELDGFHQARVESGWCFHDYDRIIDPQDVEVK